MNTQYITSVSYKYVLSGLDKEFVLNIDENDIIQNADGELDCPLETVLRKNHYSFTDLTKWNIQTIHFVEIVNEVETSLRQIDLNINI